MTHHPASKTRCDGDDLHAMFVAAAELFQHNVDLLNRLNVFPVPDGDTGTNMYLTLVDTLSQDAERENVLGARGCRHRWPAAPSGAQKATAA